MPWHRLGTVSVTQNSATVTGVNTGFAANTRIGDAFIGPDGRQYELGNVASDTVISIIPPYLGPTVAGATYSIAPIQGYQKGLADQVRDWVNTYGTKMAALGTTGNYDTLPVTKGGTGGATQAAARTGLGLGTAAVADVTTSATDTTPGRTMKVGCCGIGLTTGIVNVDAELASGIYQAASSGGGTYPAGFGNGSVIVSQRNAVPYRGNQILASDGDGRMWRRANNGAWTPWIELVSAGANSTITSLTGLSTALSVAQGGTGNNTGTAAALAASKIVGTVSQSSGVPTGAILERNSNANGEYIRFADGTQIAWKSFVTNSTGTYPVGSLFGSDAYGSGSFPAAFIAVPTIVPSCTRGSSSPGAWPSCYTAWTASSWGAWRTVATDNSAVASTIFLIAIGRWY